jgi:APA family basic amino acid/polyamine antiporter
MGEFVAWIMGVLLLLEYGVAASTVAVGWSGYVVQLLKDLGLHLPHALTQAPGALVASSLIETVTTNPTVSLSGAAAVLSDGTQVVFNNTAQAVVAGEFPIRLDEYTVVASRLLDVSAANTATLVDATQATLREAAAGAAPIDVPAGSAITFAGDAKVSLASS